MALEIADTRQNTYETYGEGQYRPVRSNRRGELVVTDFWQQLIFDGRMFHMQIGTESAGVDTTTTAADTLVWMLLDGVAGTTIIPALYEVAIEELASAVSIETYLEIDRAKARYASGGTAFVPTPMRCDSPRVSVAAAAYVGTDITALAKTAVPGSIEIGHHTYTEEAINPATGNELHKYVLNAKTRPLGVVVGVGSVLCHCAATTGDAKAQGCLQWAEIPTAQVT
ncbi:MAG: hypothetical protein ACYTEX_23315 [Planctomycetota bacterium]|jgi:hypothetical protein